MFKGIPNLASIVKQAHDMGGKMQEVNSQLKVERVKGSAGGGLVEVEANGLGDILRVRIDPSLEDREMLEDLLPGAINQASDKARQLHIGIMEGLSDLEIPGLSDAISQITNEPPGPNDR
jgi:DNA-binding YbaB/EbfC family protein